MTASRRIPDMPRPFAPSPRSRFIAACLGISFALGIGVIQVLLTLNVRIGQGYFAYRYSPVRDLRTPRALAVVPIALIACAAIWLLAKRESLHRWIGRSLLALAMLSAGAWAWWAPPAPLVQHMFNLTSPSSDGAFFVEAAKIGSASQYLRNFPERIRTQTPKSMNGTRVLSNPPGMTLFAHAINPMHGREWGWLEEAVARAGELAPEEAPLFADTVRLAVALCLVWSLAGAAAYLLGRVFLSPAGAAVFAILVTFNPAVVHFVPGKDPAQLLTINLMLCAWFAGVKRRNLFLCGLSGAIFVLGCTVGLIHIWVAIAVALASMWERRPLLEQAIGAGIGAACVIATAWIALNWNIPLTLWAVSRRWSEIQKTFDMNRPLWYLIGLPIFLLFVSPGPLLLAGLSIRRRRLHFGTRLAICTVVVMLFTYLIMGVTYELPRLWMAFLPPLTLGLAIDFPLLRSRGLHPRVARVLMLIVLTQMIYTAFHWTLFDVRETEYRLVNKRFYT